MNGFVKRFDHAVLISSVILFLFSFTLSYPSFHFITEFYSHQSSELQCDDHEEQNACHQFIIHHNHESECFHLTHVVKKENHCDFCAQLTLVNTFIDELLANERQVIESDKKPVNYLSSRNFSFYIFSPEGRGPPVLI